MSSKQYSLFFLVFLIISCANDRKEQPVTTLNEEVVNEQSPTNLDSITKVDVVYYPAFNNSSVLHLDRIKGVGSYQVDTTLKYTYAAPKKFIFPLVEFEFKLNNKRLWDERFIQSLRIDTTRPIPTDGMSVWIYYTKGQNTDSIYLGNSHPRRVDSILLDQLNYLNDRTRDNAMKHYLKDVKSYL